jgi:3D (Asp-Asp-Asp) domain-containing protein
MAKFRAAAALIFAVTCQLRPPAAAAPAGGMASTMSDATEDFKLPPPVTLIPAARRVIWATAYIDYLTTASALPGSVPLLDQTGARFDISLPHADWCHAAMEGTVTVRLNNAKMRTFNYAGVGRSSITDCKDIFTKVKPSVLAGTNRATFAEVPASAPFGLGARGDLRLVPLRSIAVDQTIFQIETVLFIPSLKGTKVELPDGRQTVHDGYVMAVDTGGAIQGRHIDFFKGPSRNDTPPLGLTSDEKHPIVAYIVNDPAIAAPLLKMHKRI